MTWLLSLSCVLLAMAVALGAFAAHGLRGVLDERSLSIWQTAVHYHFVHALAVLSLMLWARATTETISTSFIVGVVLLLLGILCFSGSLYGLAIAQWRWLGPITPLGGLFFIAGWLTLAVSFLRLDS